MSEPRRLLDETTSDLERTLLSVGRSYRSTARTRQRALAALGLTGSGLVGSAASASTMATAARRLSSGLARSKLMWGLSLAGLAAVPLVATTGTPQGSLPSPQTAGDTTGARAAPAASPARPAEVAASPLVSSSASARSIEPARRDEGPEASPAAPAPARRDEGPEARHAAPAPARRATTPRAGTARAHSIADELSRLDKARSQLARGQGSVALGILDDYARAYTGGTLRLEAEVLRMDALALSGQTDAARRKARAFLERNPSSALASRVRRHLRD